MAGNIPSDHEENMGGAFCDKILNRLAKKVGDEWRDIAYELDFDDPEIQQIRAQVPQTETNYLVAVTFQIFRKWRCRNQHLSDEEIYNKLKEAFQQSQKQNLVYHLDQLVDITAIRGQAVMKQQTHQTKQSTDQQLLSSQHDDVSMKVLNLSTIRSTTHRKVQAKKLSSFPRSLKLVRGELWSCENDGIAIYNLDLEAKRRISSGKMGEINSVADIGDYIAVASLHGLWTVSYEGKPNTVIDRGLFSDVFYHSGCVYAASYDNSRIYVYNPQDWIRTRTIETGCDTGHFHTFSVTSKGVVLACLVNNCVYNLDKRLDRVDRKGQPQEGGGQFCTPRLFQSDWKSTLIVADEGSNRLQLLHENEWHVLQLKPQPGKPVGVVCTENALYAVCLSYPRTLVKYQLTP